MYSLILFIYLKGEEGGERERDGERERALLFSGLFAKCLQWPGFGQAEAGS